MNGIFSGLTGIINGRFQRVIDRDGRAGLYIISDSGNRGKRHWLTVFKKDVIERLHDEEPQSLIQVEVLMSTKQYTDQNGNKFTRVNQVVKNFTNLESKSVREARASRMAQQA